jgi:sulfoxide reductase heme-binding subunit YedZ
MLGSIPFATLIGDFAFDGFGPEPVEEITHRTGKWALRMLLLSLSITPLRRLLATAPLRHQLRWLAAQRRTLGLLCFFYATLHFSTYLVFELELRFGELGHEVAERPYITVGFTTFVLLACLAVTSTTGWMRRLGRRWTSLHRIVYLAAIGAVLHFVWSVKADLREPLTYAAIAMGLLLYRLARIVSSRRNVLGDVTTP